MFPKRTRLRMLLSFCTFDCSRMVRVCIRSFKVYALVHNAHSVFSPEGHCIVLQIRVSRRVRRGRLASSSMV